MQYIAKSLLLLNIFFSFNCKSIDKETNSPSATSSQSSTQPSLNTPKNANTIETKAVTCINVELSGIWKELVKDRDVMGMIIDAKIGGDCSDYIEIKQTVNLNSDKRKELIVGGKGTFGAVSTIPIWVMQKQKDVYKVLLREQGEICFVKKSRTNGYNDLFFPSRRTVMSTFLSSYKFKNGVYYKSKCQIEFNYQPDKLRRVFDCKDEKGIDKFETTFKPIH